MSKRHFILILMLFIITGSAGAEEKLNESCLARAAMTIKKDNLINIFPVSGGSIRGRLLAADAKESLISIYRIDSSGSHRLDFRAADILKIEYGQKWKFKPKHLLFGAIGFLAGATIGQQVEKLIDSGYKIKFYPFERRLAYEDGAFFGGVAGAMAGILLPMAIGSKGTINCGK